MTAICSNTQYSCEHSAPNLAAANYVCQAMADKAHGQRHVLTDQSLMAKGERNRVKQRAGFMPPPKNHNAVMIGSQ